MSSTSFGTAATISVAIYPGASVLTRIAVPFVFGALFFPVALPGDVLTWVAFLGAVVLAMLVGFGIRFLVALSAFWLLDGTGVVQMAWLAGFFCSGMLLPLESGPEWMQVASKFNPLTYLVNAERALFA